MSGKAVYFFVTTFGEPAMTCLTNDLKSMSSRLPSHLAQMLIRLMDLAPKL
jgi:hypothetical protein